MPASATEAQATEQLLYASPTPTCGPKQNGLRPSLTQPPALLRPQRQHRTNSCGAPRGQPGREQGCGREQEGGTGKCNRIERANLIKHAAKNFSGRDRKQQSDSNPTGEYE